MRIAGALLFFQHGAEKLFGFAGARRVPDLFAQRGVAGLLETIGPVLLALGLYLWMMTAGPGAYSLDEWIDGQRGPHPFRALKRKLAGFEPYTRSIMRAIVGFLVIEHGARKIFDVLPIVGGRRNVPPLAIDGLPALTGYIDLIAGALLIVGLFARPAAVVVAAEMLAAYFLVATVRGPWPIRNSGGEALVHVVINIYIALMGAGILSLDHVIAKREHAVKEVLVQAGLKNISIQ